MLEKEIKSLLNSVKKGETGIEDALEKLRELPFSDLGFAKIDQHRALRRGFPEVIYCPGKTPSQLQEIVKKRLEDGGNILATKASEEAFKAIKKAAPEARYFESARLILVEREKRCQKNGLVLVVTAGTTDIPVAEEAAITAELMGTKVERIYDVGVAGVHRLIAFRNKLSKARAIVAVAGMEGALPSLIGGMVGCPVIAVPTSVGYGASFRGITALLSMLNSCAPGVAVVNIDNGFGAGYLAALINQRK
ncbi:MAG: nickel pincer cofactor biosynthesis protein LarB [Actinomycetota bacterium]